MGTIRLLLALSVVLRHTDLGIPLGMAANVSVQSFFLISGFVIALVYPRKYKGPIPFWTARYLRLYPVYIFCAILSIASITPTSVLFMEGLSLSSQAFLLLANLSIFFQDLVMFLGIDIDGGLQFTSQFSIHPNPAWPYLWLPQAWSLGMELGFYLLAPWLFLKRSRLIAVFLGSILIKQVVKSYGLDHDPWSYRFFPVELGTFCLGALLFHLLEFAKSKLNAQRIILLGKIGLITCLILLIGYEYFQQHFPIRSLWKTCFFIFMPFVFALTKDWKFDRFLGDLSYPVYCVHILLIHQVLPLFSQYSSMAQLIILLASCILSGIIIKLCIEAPFEKLRNRFHVRHAT